MVNLGRATATCGAMLAMMLAATPAFSQADFTGVWGARYQEDQPERIPGPEIGDYTGLPINDAARKFADSWDPSRVSLLEHQCEPYVSPPGIRHTSSVLINPCTSTTILRGASANAALRAARVSGSGAPSRTACISVASPFPVRVR